MSTTPELNVIELPKANARSIPDQLRDLAKHIEDGSMTDIDQVAWVAHGDGHENHVHVGLCGMSDLPLLRAYLLLNRGARVIEHQL